MPPAGGSAISFPGYLAEMVRAPGMGESAGILNYKQSISTRAVHRDELLLCSSNCGNILDREGCSLFIA